MANKFDKLEDMKRSFWGAARGKCVQIGSLSEALGGVTAQNEAFIRLAEEALRKQNARGAAFSCAIDTLCYHLVPGEDKTRNYSRTVLAFIQAEMTAFGRPGIVEEQHKIVEEQHKLDDALTHAWETSDLLLDRLEELKPTAYISEARFNIGSIFMSLADPLWRAGTSQSFAAATEKSFKLFFQECGQNIQLLHMMSLGGENWERLEAQLKDVGRVGIATYKVCTGHEQEVQSDDVFEALRQEWIQDGVDLILGAKEAELSLIEAARLVLEKRAGEAVQIYTKGQEKTFAKAISRAVEKQGVRVKICRGKNRCRTTFA